uniref:Uncharacterized protein n=1 Tax=Thermosporothrix sp. COM3 TaxID=2490863 RepID=A0A455STQ9_9CHLR|nr:hypothetical protein KTC_41960 [Thermosporothrix sp. COM3]
MEVSNVQGHMAIGMFPSFPGLVQGEITKLMRHPLTWVAGLLSLCGLVGVNLLILLTDIGNDARSPLKDPVGFWTNQFEGLMFVRVCGGLFLIMITAYLIGMEYHFGTIRVVLGRGVGKLQLLFAKLTALLIMALGMLVISVLVYALGSVVNALILAGNLNSLSALKGENWKFASYFLSSALISHVVTIIMAAAMAVLGRSLAFGMTAALCWFAVDNMATIMLYLVASFTHNDIFLKIQTYLLGPDLNALVSAWAGQEHVRLAMFTPIVNGSYSSTQFLLVIAGYTVALLAIAVFFMARRDVKE